MDPLTSQGVGKMFRGTAGMQSRVVSPLTVSNKRTPRLVSSLIASYALTNPSAGHVDFGDGNVGVFTYLGTGSGGDGHLRYEVWAESRNSLSRTSTTDLGLLPGAEVRIDPTKTSGIVDYFNSSLANDYARGITLSGAGVSFTDASPGSTFSSADGSAWCAFSNTRYFGSRDDGSCVVGTKESGSWDVELTRPTGWAVNSRIFRAGLSLSTTETMVVYTHVASGETRAAVVTVDTSSGHPFTMTPSAETTLTLNGSLVAGRNPLEPLGLRLSSRSAEVSDGTTVMTLTATSTVTASDVYTLPTWWRGQDSARISSGHWFGTLNSGVGVGLVSYDGGWVHGLTDLTSVVSECFPMVGQRDRYVNIPLGEPKIQVLQSPHYVY